VTPAAPIDPTLATARATPPLAYHRLSHANPAYRWWKPIVVAVVAFVIYLIFAIVVLRLLESIASALLSELEYNEYSRQILSPNSVLTSPLAIAALLLSVLVMTPALLLARRLMGLGGLGFLSSVAGRLRWRWFGIALIPASAYMGVQLIIGYGVAPLFDTEPLGAVTVSATTFGLSLMVILLLVPLQASAEEYVFRGFVMQAVGGWVRWPAIAIVASTIPFVLGHVYNVWGLLEVLVFALVAAWVTLRTGGLEAAIGVHILTNVIAFSVPALGFENVTESNGSPEGLVTAAILLPLYAWGIDVLFRRSGLSRTFGGATPVERSPQLGTTAPPVEPSPQLGTTAPPVEPSPQLDTTPPPGERSPQPDHTTPPAVGGTS
jgi:membrane protease YdiL (CAAX protease family)